MKKSIRLLKLKEEEGIELTQEEYLELKLARRDQEQRKKALKKGISISKKILLTIVTLGVTGGIIAGGIVLYDEQKRKKRIHQEYLAECNVVKEKILSGDTIIYHDLKEISSFNTVCSIEEFGYKGDSFSEEEISNLSPEQRDKYIDSGGRYRSVWWRDYDYFIKLGDESGTKIMPE